MAKKYNSKIAAAVHETMSGLYYAGVLPKSTMREFDELCLALVRKLTPEEIKAIRDEAHASQTFKC